MKQRFLWCIFERNIHLLSSVRMGRRKRHNKRNPVPYKNERNYRQTTKENELFKKYYAGLGLMPAEEVEDFYNQMKEPLPVTFRITGYKSQAKELLKIIRTQFFNSLIGQTPSASSSTTTTTATATPESSAPPTANGAAGSAVDVKTSEETVTKPAESVCEKGGNSTATPSAGGDGDCKSDGTGKGLTMEAIKPPKCLTWYPDELAWQIDLSRKAVRSQEILSKLHQFLVSETETGNISRQEAVSMIPPLVLDVQSNSRVLDLCAAPGSKTAQLIEYLHKDEISVPEGIVVANDKENKRCYLMVHQVKRLASPCCMIVNHDAAFFPKLRCSADEDKPEHIMFDRVLADVPCSGDGTMRKNIDIWKKWNPAMGNSLHGLQLKILKRGLELLEVGGRLVYSTCSLQPVEDEAVIAEMLRKCEGSVRLVDISSFLPGFKTVPGLSQWKLMNKLGNWVEDFDSVPDRFKGQYNRSMFPPSPEEALRFKLNLCHRILPHHQDTGGFFVAALEKVDHLPWSREARLEKEKASKSASAAENSAESSEPAEKSTASSLESADGVANTSTAEAQSNSNSNSTTEDSSRKRKAESEDGPQPKKRDLKGYKEDPFLFLDPQDPVFPAIREFYGLSEKFPVEQLLYRSEKGPKRALYFVSKAVRQIVTSNEGRVRFINMGVKFVTRSPSPLVPSCDFRITQECLGSVRDMFSKRVITITKSDAITIFKEENPFLDKLSEATQKVMKEICPGSVVFVYQPTESEPEPACEVAFCGWRGKTSVRCFVPRFERVHGLRLFGQDLALINAEVEKMKAQRRERSGGSSSTTPTTTTTAAEDKPPTAEEEEDMLTMEGEGEKEGLGEEDEQAEEELLELTKGEEEEEEGKEDGKEEEEEKPEAAEGMKE